MATRYVSAKTLELRIEPPPSGKGEDKSLTLIYGDEVETIGPEQAGKVPIEFRGRNGRVAVKALDTQPRLECYFLDVGQGDAALIVTPGRKRILIDGGKSPAKGRVSEAVLALNWLYRLDERIQPVVIDLVVLSHADEDHIGGLVSVFEHPKLRVKKVLHSGIATFAANHDDDELGERKTIDGTEYLIDRHSSADELDKAKLSTDYLSFVTAIGLHAESSAAVKAGDVIDIGDPAVKIEALGPRPVKVNNKLVYPWLGDKAHTINGHSVVLRLTYNDVSVLLPGDINTDGSELLLADPTIATKLDAHVLKAPHHGSHEFSPKFLDAINPQITAISSGEIPDHGHPRLPNSWAPSGSTPAATSRLWPSPPSLRSWAPPASKRSRTKPTSKRPTRPTAVLAYGSCSNASCPASSTSAPTAERCSWPPGS